MARTLINDLSSGYVARTEQAMTSVIQIYSSFGVIESEIRKSAPVTGLIW